MDAVYMVVLISTEGDALLATFDNYGSARDTADLLNLELSLRESESWDFYMVRQIDYND